jgi:uroporphyrinogen decarboxylase
MTPRERLLTALQHREPDRVPFDISSNQVTGIHAVAYRSLRRHLNLAESETVLSDSIQGLAQPSEDFLTRLKADVRGLFPRCSHNWNIREKLIDDYWEYRDEWGIVHHRPKDGGLYYSIVAVPLGQPMLSVTDLRRYRAPDFTNPERIEGLQNMAAQYRSRGLCSHAEGSLCRHF